MRSLQLLDTLSVCEDESSLRDPAVRTVADARTHAHRQCPLFAMCAAGQLLGPNLHNCIPRMAQDVAQFAAKPGATLDAEMHDFDRAPVFSKLGFIDPYDRPDPDATITDRGEIGRRVREWAGILMDGEPASLEQQVAQAHCDQHKTHTVGCRACGIAKAAVLDKTELVMPGGQPQLVPRNICRCPILRVGDSCPVHGG